MVKCRRNRGRLLSGSFAVLFLLFALPDVVTASDFNAGIGFVYGITQGEFRDNVDDNVYGFSIEGVYQPKILPFGIGFEFGYLNYGHTSRKETISSNIPDMRVRVSNDNNIMSGNLIVRYKPYTGFLTPYLDGFVGIRYLYTDTEIRGTDSLDSMSSKNFDDTTYGYGIGTGVMMRLYHFAHFSKKDKEADLLLDIKCRYIVGGKAEYLKEGSIQRNNDKITYDVHESDTNMLLFYIGLTLGL